MTTPAPPLDPSTLSVRQPEVQKELERVYKEKGGRAVLDYLFNFSIRSGYIQEERLKLNIIFSPFVNHPYEVPFIVTINCSKPEIIQGKDAPPPPTKFNFSGQCAICFENVDAPTRPGLRAFEFEMSGRDIFLQLPPYPYFNQHNIIIEKKHIPQLVTPDTIKDLVDLSKMVRVCVATNSDKEGTGCTNLEHKHYQAGNYPYAVFDAKPISVFEHNGVQVHWLKYPAAAVKVVGGDREKVLAAGSSLLNAWRNGSYSGLENTLQTFCMICRFNGEGDDVAPHLINQWELVIIPRNADPRFRTRSKLHCIKKEFVGIFEMAGYAILPGRLSTQLKQLGEILHQQEQGQTVGLGDLHVFEDWVSEWYAPVKNSAAGSALTTEKRVEQALKNSFLDILSDNSPFAHDDPAFMLAWLVQAGIVQTNNTV